MKSGSRMPWKDRRLTVFMFVRIAYLKEIKEETFIMIDRCISTVLIWWHHKCICNWKFSPKQIFNTLEGGQHQSQSNEKHFKLQKRRRRIDLKESAKMHIACIFNLFKPDASFCWQLWQYMKQLSVGETLLQRIKNFNLSPIAVMKVVLSFYFVCLTWVALQKSELATWGGYCHLWAI